MRVSVKIIRILLFFDISANLLTFQMKPLLITHQRRYNPYKLKRIDVVAIYLYAPMQMGAVDPAGGSGQTDELAFGNLLIRLNIDSAEMGIRAENSGAMVNNDDLAGKK